MENSLKECLPPQMKGFIIKRRAKLTPDQAKHLNFFMPTRGLEADRYGGCFESSRLELTRLWTRVLGDSEQNWSKAPMRAHAHTSNFLKKQ